MGALYGGICIALYCIASLLYCIAKENKTKNKTKQNKTNENKNQKKKKQNKTKQNKNSLGDGPRNSVPRPLAACYAPTVLRCATLCCAARATRDATRGARDARSGKSITPQLRL